MMIAFQVLLFVMTILFAIVTMGTVDNDKKQATFAKVTALGILSLLITFWI